MGILKRAIAADASVVVSVLDATDIVNEIEKIHKTSAVVTAGLGRLSIAASLMGYMLKGENDTITLRVDGGGPTGALIAVSNSKGNVKSYVSNPVVEIPLNKYGKLDVGTAVGKTGTLSVIKDLGLKEPYIGRIPLVSGEIAEDIASYYANSEQIPTVCGLGVLVNPDLSVNVAGGYLVQLLPFAGEEVISTIEKNIDGLPSVTAMMSSGLSVEDIAMKLLSGLEPNILDESKLKYFCDCTEERVKKAIMSVGNEELKSMAEEPGDTKVVCHFCNKEYSFDKNQILSLIK